MGIEFLVCNSCGSRNSSVRMACLNCGTNLRDSNASVLDGSIQASEVGNLATVTKWILILSVVLRAVSLFYHYVITVPKLERVKIEVERQEKLEKESKLKAEEAAAEKARADAAWLEKEEARKKRETEQAQAQIDKELRAANERRSEYEKTRNLQLFLTNCLKSADKTHSEIWERHCSLLGRPKGCLLPNPVASHYELGRRQSRDECYARFNTFK